MPACSPGSSRDPVRIQKPSEIERTEGIASVTTRTPESSVVSRRLRPDIGALPVFTGVRG